MATTGKGQPTRQGAAYWAPLVKRWKASGIPRRRFAQREGLVPKTFAYWVWRLANETPVLREPEVPLRLVPIRSAESTPSVSCARYELRARSGASVFADASFDEQVVVRLLRLLETL